MLRCHERLMYTRLFIDDLIHAILEADTHWWPRDLQRLTLVSTAWVGPVRRQLYQHIRLSSFDNCDLLTNSLQDNPRLGLLIKSVDLRPWLEHSNPGLTEKDLWNIQFILNLPRLTSVTIGGQLVFAAERLLHRINNPSTLIELYIDGAKESSNGRYLPCYEPPPSFQLDEGIGQRFQNLRKLQLSNVEITINAPATFRLTNLALNSVNFVQGSLHQLCYNSRHTISRLSIVSDEADDLRYEIRSILEESMDNLEAFSYEVPDHPGIDEAIFNEDHAPLPSLKELRLRGIDVNLDSIQRRCQRLERLSVLGRVVRIPCQEWMGFIRSGALPFLRQLSMPFGNGPPFVYWSDSTVEQLTDICIARGIDISHPFL